MAHDEQDYVDGWFTYSNWIDDLRNDNEIISSYDSDSTFKTKLLNCKTNLERFNLIWLNESQIIKELSRIYQEDKIELMGWDETKKNIDESAKSRELGNKSFKEANYLVAVRHYTKAVKFAPYPAETNKTSINAVPDSHSSHDDSFGESSSSTSPDEDTVLSLALANRSAANYALKRYRLCLSDIELALKYNYPQSKIFKLLVRKLKCLHILSVWANDIETIKDRLGSLARNPKTNINIKNEINSMFEFLEQTKPQEVEKVELDVIDETNMTLTNFSRTVAQGADCVEMTYDEEKGRYLFTNRDASFGRLLIDEPPFACNLAPSKRDHYCYHCFAKLHGCGIGCLDCSQILYCSEDCLEANRRVHKHECRRLFNFHEKIGVAYLVAHIMFKINFNPNFVPITIRKTTEKKQLVEVLKMAPSDWVDVVFRNDYAGVLSLMDHAEDYDYDALMGFALTSVYLMVAFIDQFSVHFPGIKHQEKQSTVGSVILRHLLQLQTNLISILDQNLQDLVLVGREISEMRETPIGVGIYPTVSLMNHSCNPNMISIFNRNNFVARASRFMPSGTEMNYCYGPSVARMSRKDRRQRLKEQYFFHCECKCCVEEKENEARAMLCPKCKGPVVYNHDLTNKCLACKEIEVINAGEYVRKMTELTRRLKEIKESGIESVEKIALLKAMEVELTQIAFWRHPLFVKIKADLILYAEQMQDLDKTLRFCSEELDLCNKTYGPKSYESVMTRLKIINLKWEKFCLAVDGDAEQEPKSKVIEDLKSLQQLTQETRARLKELLVSTNILGAESSFEIEMKFLNDVHGQISDYLGVLESPDDVGLENLGP